MALNTSTLFPQDGLFNDTGLLKERWAQEGSTAITIVGENRSNNVLYTVTAGKVYYMTGMTISEYLSNSGNFELRDDVTTKFAAYESPSGQSKIYQLVFSTPIKFETEIECVEHNPCSSTLTITGWEEKA